MGLLLTHGCAPVPLPHPQQSAYLQFERAWDERMRVELGRYGNTIDRVAQRQADRALTHCILRAVGQNDDGRMALELLTRLVRASCAKELGEWRSAGLQDFAPGDRARIVDILLAQETPMLQNQVRLTREHRRRMIDRAPGRPLPEDPASPPRFSPPPSTAT